MVEVLEDVGGGGVAVRDTDNGRVYVKPIIEKCEGMTFSMDIMEKYNGRKYCIQCSGCHGCR